MDSGPQSEFGWAQQDVTNLNELRAPWVGDLGGVGLGLGEMPLRRWEAVTEMGRSQALIRTIATPSQRQTIDRGTTHASSYIGRLHRPVSRSMTRFRCRMQFAPLVQPLGPEDRPHPGRFSVGI